MTNEQIINALPSGAQTRIAEHIGISRQAVNKALKGQMRGAKAERVIKEAKLVLEATARKYKAREIRSRVERMSDEELLKWSARLEDKLLSRRAAN